MDSMGTMAVDTSPVHRINSASSEGECEGRSPVSSVGPSESERPERMRDWLIRMINSGRFIGLEWLDKEKTVFKVPWIHAKKRGYCRERDAALFREWAIHSGKYRQDSDPTVWKINFRCAINGLKDIQEIKDMQTEDCRVYKVYPSRSRRRRRAVRRTAVDPYPNCSTAYTDMGSSHLYSGYPGMNPYGMSCGINSVSSSDSLYSSYAPNVKLEYPTGPMCLQSSHYNLNGLPAVSSSIPASLNGVYPSSPSTVASTASTKQGSYYTPDHVVPIQGGPNLPSKSSHVAFSRIDSPDSGINVEVQNSPSMVHQNSPLAQQHSPLAQQHSPMAQQHSPLAQQQHSPAGFSQTHSPPPHVQSHHTPSPLAREQKPFSQPNNCSMGMSSPIPMNCHSPSSTINSPAPTINSEPEVEDILSALEDTSPTPPISPHIPPGELQVRIYYGTIQVHSEFVDCSKGPCRIVSTRSYSCSSPEDKRRFGYTHPIFLPENHPQALSKDIFDAMGNGIVLDVSNEGGIYVTPLCRTIVYCSGSASPGQDASQLNKDRPTKVFDYANHFRPALEQFALIQGQSPSPYFLLGLGQTWGQRRHVTQNLISIVVTHCKAKHDIDAIALPELLAQELLIEIPDTINIDPPTTTDLEADAFLKNLQEISS